MEMPIITNKGLALLTKVSNNTLNLSYIALGSGESLIEESIESLKNEEIRTKVEYVQYKGTKMEVRATFSNEDIEKGFYVTEIGLYAIDPNEGEILYAYTCVKGADADYFTPKSNSLSVNEVIQIIIGYGNASKVNLIVDNKLVYMTAEDYGIISKRVESVDSQLQQTATNKIDKDGNGQVTWANFAQDAREQITGGAVAVVGENAVLEVNLTNNAVSPRKTSFLKVRKNKFNKNSSFTNGAFISDRGVVTSNAAYSYSEPSYDLNPSTVYIGSGFTQLFITFYNNDDTFITGRVVGSAAGQPFTFTTPSEFGYVIYSTRTDWIPSVQIEEGTVTSSYEDYAWELDPDIKFKDSESYITFDEAEIIVDEKISDLNTNITITVKKDGTGDFIRLTDAINSIVDSNENKVYTICIYEGTYDIFAESGTYRGFGLTLPDYVNIKGIGELENIVLKGYIPQEKLTIDNCASMSTINMKHNNNIENIKITAQNCRYAVHDESGNGVKRFKRLLKNCHIEHYGNPDGYWASVAAYGMGGSDGCILIADKCKFISTNRSGLLCHDNANFEKGVHLEFNNCEFICKNYTETFNGLRLSTYSTGSKENVCILNNCIMTGLVVAEETVGSGNRWKVIGGGNSKCAYSRINTVGDTAKIIFSDEIKELKNVSGALIKKGTPVKFFNGGVTTVTDQEESYTIIGVAFENIAPNEVGVIKTNGFVSFADLGISSASTNDKIGIKSDGSIGTITSGDYFGIANGSYGTGKGIYLKRN